MALKLQLQELEHQALAIEAVCAAFAGIEFDRDTRANAEITPEMREHIQENILEIQKGNVDGLLAIPEKQRTVTDEPYLGIDVKMETGTGKTYVFTRLMFELHKQFGFNKFILLTPSSAIREGTANFINSDYADEHFRQHYESRIVLQTLEGAPKTKSGRKMIPTEIREYAEGGEFDSKRIDALIMTDAMLRAKTITRDDYDQALGSNGFDSSCPKEILARTRPVVIIDEPHRFRRDNKTYNSIRQLNPSLVLRFGATFPRMKTRKGQPQVIDYDNLVYDLTSADAFNNLLVKGVKVQYPEIKGTEGTKFKVTELRKSPKEHRGFTLRDETTKKSYEFTVQDNQLGKAHPSLNGITLENVATSTDLGVPVAMLSNGAELPKDYILMTGSFSQSYQETMMEQALENHFETELELFEREQSKIKPSTLFFIDSIQSYRGENNDGWLLTAFEKMLKQAVKKTIKKIEDKGALTKERLEYLDYLQATLDDISATHGGYFAEDLGTSDEEVAKQVREILSDKQQLMSFKDEKGNWNTRRFIFSKWTLREGWDLPNVFQIVKMRSSGSEVSKLQEVGRGLRLPVDEDGLRQSEGAEQFYLTYLVDFTEKDFADRLVGEINADTQRILNVKNKIEDVAKESGVEAAALWKELVVKDFIDMEYNVNAETEELFLEEYPEFATGLNRNRVRDEGKEKTENKKLKAKVRPKAYERLRELWTELSERYVLIINKLSDDELDAGLDAFLENDIFDRDYRSIMEREIKRGKDGAPIELGEVSKAGHYEANTDLSYGEFLKRAHKQTGLPVDTIHRGIVRRNAKKPIENEAFNLGSLTRFVRHFSEWFDETFQSRFEYAHVGSKVNSTKLTNSDGSPREEVLRTTLGQIADTQNVPPETYLYDVYDWDSDFERKTMIDSESRGFDGVVEVYGKIPSKSIKIPTYSGGTTSPDFMYVIKRDDGSQSVNFVAETKGMNTSRSLRETEKDAIHSADQFFSQMREKGIIDVTFRKVLNSDGMIRIIEGLQRGEVVDQVDTQKEI